MNSLPPERFLYDKGQHPMILGWPLCLGVPGCLLIGAFLPPGPVKWQISYFLDSGHLHVWLALFGLVLIVLPLLVLICKRALVLGGSRLGLTDSRVLFAGLLHFTRLEYLLDGGEYTAYRREWRDVRRGGFARLSVPLSRLEEVSVLQSLPGRMLGYGTVAFMAPVLSPTSTLGANSGRIKIPYVRNPIQFRDNWLQVRKIFSGAEEPEESPEQVREDLRRLFPREELVHTTLDEGSDDEMSIFEFCKPGISLRMTFWRWLIAGLVGLVTGVVFLAVGGPTGLAAVAQYLGIALIAAAILVFCLGITSDFDSFL
jgi:hypothetical protein